MKLKTKGEMRLYALFSSFCLSTLFSFEGLVRQEQNPFNHQDFKNIKQIYHRQEKDIGTLIFLFIKIPYLFQYILCPECSAMGMVQFPICRLKWDLLRTSVTACKIDKNTISAPFGIFYVRTEI